MFDSDTSDSEEDDFEWPRRQQFLRIRRFLKYLCLGIAILFGTIHYYYVSSLFENDRNFSHLSELEREMSFRTEMGFYYSYYKTIVNENQLKVAISKLIYDRKVEYPKEINAFNRFNIHPEVLIGILYRNLKPWLDTIDPRVCHLVSRDDLKPIESCVGLSEPIFFYLEAIWWLAGITLAIFIMFAFYFRSQFCVQGPWLCVSKESSYVPKGPNFVYPKNQPVCAQEPLHSFCQPLKESGSVAGAVLTGLMYAVNHDNITRVQWTPNERENFAYPFLLLQMWLVTRHLRTHPDEIGALGSQLVLLLVNAICLSLWQFTQFIFLTQVAVFFLMEQLHIIDLKVFCIFLHAHFCGVHIAMFLLLGNEMLKTSFFSAFFLVVSAYGLFFSYLRFKIKRRIHVFLEGSLIICRLILTVALTIWLKSVLTKYFNVQEDSHILDLLYSKLTTYKNFHTMLYTCAPVFDFMPISYFIEVTETGLLPITILTVTLFIYKWFSLPIIFYKNIDTAEEKEKTETPKTANSDDGAVENNNDAKKVKYNKRKNSKNELYADDNKNQDTKNKNDKKNKNDTKNKNDPKNKKDDTKNKSDSKTKNDDTKNKNDDTRNKNDTKIKNDDTKNKNDDIKNDTKNKNGDTKNKNDDKNKNNDTKNKNDNKNKNDEETYRDDDSKDIKHLKEGSKRKIKYDPLVVYLRNIIIDPSIFYHFAQMTAFGILALLFMRLKLLFTPHMCLVASLLMKNIQFPREWTFPRLMIWVVVCTLVGVTTHFGKEHIDKEMSHVGEFSDPEQEALLTWIREETCDAAVFAGPMPLMAAVMLSTRRAIANTPHYEHVDARLRTYNIYKVYGRFTNNELYDVLKKYQVTHLVVEKSYCYGRSKRGCTFEEIWDMEVPALRGRPRLCHRLLTDELEHFFLEYETDKYAVFRIHDYSVRYTPRLYDT
ncbi:Probable C-mannosyltransferase DPY19L1 [Eumeta japonica]|uniref:Probable C-mannosyltransferase DPY19L1 n=1 Tax=Eumeta variegata TaxID=151549 RepID=A0A4C1VCM4_EUMVA|nr:Probable C-mannosyltransferase DPY19L1 [Eumeta japonica]